MAIGSNLSAFWILIANSFMQQPVGYALNAAAAGGDDRFLAPCSPTRTCGCSFRTCSSPASATAAFFVLGISAYHLLRKSGNA